MIFLALYYFVSYRFVSGLYSVGKADSILGAFIPMIRHDKTMLILLILALFRIVDLFRGNRENVIADIFLLGGIAFIVAYIGLEMYKPYRGLPSYIFFTVAVAGYCSKPSFLRIPVMVLLAALILWQVPKTFEVIERTHAMRREQVQISKILALYSDEGYDLFYLSTKDPNVRTKQIYRLKLFNIIPKSQYREIRTIQLVDKVPPGKALLIVGPESRAPAPSLILVKSFSSYKLYRNS